MSTCTMYTSLAGSASELNNFIVKVRVVAVLIIAAVLAMVCETVQAGEFGSPPRALGIQLEGSQEVASVAGWLDSEPVTSTGSIRYRLKLTIRGALRESCRKGTVLLQYKFIPRVMDAATGRSANPGAQAAGAIALALLDSRGTTTPVLFRTNEGGEADIVDTVLISACVSLDARIRIDCAVLWRDDVQLRCER